MDLTEDLAIIVSGYLDRQLRGRGLAAFRAALRQDEALSREIATLLRINRELAAIGADILTEPIPDALLGALSRPARVTAPS